MIKLISDLALILKMALIKQLLWKPLLKKTQCPQATQNDLLLSILKQNKHTKFGREHGFAKITSYEEYKQAVSIHRYEALRGYIEKQEAEKKPYLNCDQPVMYALTSGSTGKPKYIPITKDTVTRFRQSQHIFAYAKYASIPGVYSGKVLAIVSPSIEGRLDTGTPYGSMSGLIYKSMPKFIHAKYVVPPHVFEIEDYARKYYQIAWSALSEKNITLIATANPSTLIKLDQIINEQSEQLINDIEDDNPDRAAELRQLLSTTGGLRFSDLWPNLKSVTTWTHGSCGVLIPALRKMLLPGTLIVEMGYLASEFRGGITIDVLQNREIPTLHENFFEFVEKDDWESESPVWMTLDEIETGKQYYLFVTTRYGLYRYHINDIIEVTGRFNNTPTICFVQKGKGVTNLTGEKLYEDQLVRALILLEHKHSVEFDFFVMIASPIDLQYTLYIEHQPLDLSALETYLSDLNMEFAAKLKSGRLNAIQVVFLRDGTGEAYKLHCLKQGQREGQFKMSRLHYKQEWSFDFSEYVRDQSDAAA